VGGAAVDATGAVQVWPGTPVAKALIEDGTRRRRAAARPGHDQAGNPEPGFMPGMDVRAALTVVGDGPWAPVGRSSTSASACPEGHHQREWAVGMKMVVDLPESVDLEPGTVLHTLRLSRSRRSSASSTCTRTAWLGRHLRALVVRSPVRTSYRYLQHYMQHPYLWRYLKGGTLRSWGAKSLQESGRRGEPYLAGDGYARIGEGSGSTNVLTGSGVDEAWTTGVQLAEAVLELLKAGKPFTRENLERTYVARRRASWVEAEGRRWPRRRATASTAAWSPGMIGMALAGSDRGQTVAGRRTARTSRLMPTAEEFYRGRIPAAEVEAIRQATAFAGCAGGVGLAPRPDGARRLAGHPVRRRAAGVAAGRAADGRQGAGAPGLRRPRVFRLPGSCASAAARRSASRSARPRRSRIPGRAGKAARLRPGEVYPLRRLPVELNIPGLDRSKLLLFGGWESASRAAGVTMQMIGERLGIVDQFLAVDELRVQENGELRILERVEGGQHQVSVCTGPPAVLAWATGNLPEPRNNPQVGMANMRTIMPALQKAKPAKLSGEGLQFHSVSLPQQRRETRIVKDAPVEEIAREILEWIRK
jgi:flavin-dependent dehydrogenase